MGHFVDPAHHGGHYMLGETVRVPIAPVFIPFAVYNLQYRLVTWNKSTKRKEVAESYDFWTNGPDNTYLYSTKRFKNVQ